MMLLGAALSLANYAWLKTLALMIFFGFFMVIVLRLAFSRSQRYDAAARLPLDDEQDTTTPPGEANR